jgi:hypothetical protein
VRAGIAGWLASWTKEPEGIHFDGAALGNVVQARRPAPRRARMAPARTGSRRTTCSLSIPQLSHFHQGPQHRLLSTPHSQWPGEVLESSVHLVDPAPDPQPAPTARPGPARRPPPVPCHNSASGLRAGQSAPDSRPPPSVASWRARGASNAVFVLVPAKQHGAPGPADRGRRAEPRERRRL